MPKGRQSKTTVQIWPCGGHPVEQKDNCQMTEEEKYAKAISVSNGSDNNPSFKYDLKIWYWQN